MSSNKDIEGVVIDEANQKPPLTATANEIRQLYKVIEESILPKTRKGVQDGNKVFGAAILNSDFTCVYAETNAETKCPLFHGEVHCIFEWSQRTPPAERGPAAQSSVFLSTHEPCCMCISSILWAGFPTLYYFFPYRVTTAQG
jgi:tRNA(Arg) A34 adenosine deaminase TadA